MMRRNDYKVGRKTTIEVAHKARLLREVTNFDNFFEINSRKMVEMFMRRDVIGKGLLQLIEFNAPNPEIYPNEPLAFVRYDPLRLSCDAEIWEEARLGEPRATYILAHELGHIVLHDSHAQSFNNNPDLHIKFADEQFSAEWQANTFADHLILPDYIIRRCKSIQDVIDSCNVEREFARRRWAAARLHRYIGETCPQCANFTLVRNGTVVKCDTCGSTTGCS